MKFSVLAAALVLCPLPVLAQEQAAPAPANGQTAAPLAMPAQPVWAFETSDIPVDNSYRFGRLPNGMRYIIRQNNRPEGTALVRMIIGSGSLSETDSERGLAHFLEHMAFNGSKKIPEGEMVKLLEREGLAFGADTNASTGFETTTYKLDLPRNDPALLDIALMLMRETASNLTIADGAVERERGVILSERRDRINYAQKDRLDQFDFMTPGARFTKRLPIGTSAVLKNATARDVRGFYAREYVPANTVLVVVGDFTQTQIEAAIHKHFDDWQAAALPTKPAAGPVNLMRGGATDIYHDPALSERILISRHAEWRDETDTSATRRQNLLRSIGYGIINRRLQSLARTENAPFRGAGFGTGDLFEIGRTTNLVIDSADGEWEKGLEAAAISIRRAITLGFTDAEVAEQVARALTAQQNAAASAQTRSNAALMAGAMALISDEVIPSHPRSGLSRLEAFAPHITPAAVLAALRDDAAPLNNPLIRWRGRAMPKGGARQLRKAWNNAALQKIEPLAATQIAPFGYDDFGSPGKVVSDTLDPLLGIRLIRFANGVRLNLKHTDLQADRIAFTLSVEGGKLLNTAENPLATAMVSTLPQGGLAKHSQDELQSIMAGRSVRWSIKNASDSFISSGTTTPRDLQLQFQLLTAGLIDPGYRKNAEARFQRGVTNFFKQKDATSASVLGNALGAIISDNDPRFTLQDEARYKTLDFAKLRADIGGQLMNGAIEIGLVGDLDEQAAIGIVAATLGALPLRETDFRPREDARQRNFTTDLSPRLLSHKGEASQALLHLIWPTTDDRDTRTAMRLALLERVVRLALQEQLRERLGKAYSPSASSKPSHIYRNFGTFTITASVNVGDVKETRAAIAAVLASLRTELIDADTLARARQPLLENHDNALKHNSGWLGLVRRAQSKGERIERFLQQRSLIEEITAEDIRAEAVRYLSKGSGLEVLVVPQTGKTVNDLKNTAITINK